MRKQMNIKMFGVVMAVSLAGCEMSDDGPDLDESISPLGLASPFYDTGTVCVVGGVAMHCCPSGTAMIGIHVDRNVLKCAQLTAGFTNIRTLDALTVRNDMHACPFGQLMVGVRVDRNLLACQQSAQAVTLEFVDGFTSDSFPMHVCPGNLAMAGIRVDRNQLTCDQ